MVPEDPTSRLLGEAELRPQQETEAQRMSVEEDEEAGRIHLVAYRMMADSSERTQDRRQAANNFFIAVNVALAGGYAFMVREHHAGLIVPASYLGMAICALWGVTLWYYRGLNSAKYRLLAEFEKQHQIRGYDREWLAFNERNPFGWMGRKLGLSLTTIELFIAALGFGAHFFAPQIFQAPAPPTVLTETPACYRIVPVAEDQAAAAQMALKSRTWYCVAPGQNRETPPPVAP